MDNCPLELWETIIFQACTDGGYTACSLSLVSRRMYDMVTPARYNSVSLVGEQQLRAFATRLAAQETVLVVRHLFMSTKAAEAKVIQEKARIEVIMRTILISCARHLRSLVIEKYYDFDLTSGLPVFPLLRDITIGTVNWYTAANSHTRFPSLRKLHLLSLPRISHSFWLAITKFAPHITHLRLSRITRDTDISRFLRIILDIPRALCQCPGPTCFSGACHEFAAETAHASEAISIAARLPHLEYIYVQPGVYAPRPRRTGHFENSQMVEGLEAIASASARGEGVGRLVLLPPRASYTFEDVQKDWLETVEGKDGPWPPAAPGAWSASVRAGWPEGHHAYRPGHHPPL